MSRTVHHTAFTMVLGVVFGLAGCSGDDVDSDLAHSSCEGKEFTPTTTFDGQIAGFDASLISAEPAEATAGLNTWTLELDAPDGTVVTLTPYMPIHGHGTSPEDFSGTVASGEVTVGPFDLLMPGPWLFTLMADDSDQTAEFTLCVGG